MVTGTQQDHRIEVVDTKPTRTSYFWFALIILVYLGNLHQARIKKLPINYIIVGPSRIEINIFQVEPSKVTM